MTPQLGRRVALKCLQTGGRGGSALPGAAFCEKRARPRPSITRTSAPIYEVGEADGRPYIAMQ